LAISWMRGCAVSAPCAGQRDGIAVSRCCSSGLAAKIGAGCGPFCRYNALMTMAETATVAVSNATNSRGCSLIAAPSRPTPWNLESLRYLLGTFLHPVIRDCFLAIAVGELHRLARRPLTFAIERQPHGHARPLAHATADVDVAAVQIHQALDDREPEAGAVAPAAVGTARLEKGFAEPRQIGLADADAGIFHRHGELRSVA